MLNPLLFMIVLTVVFSQAMRIEMESYPLYVLSGLIMWNLVAQSVTLGVNSFIDNASLLKKVSAPSWIFPAAVVGSASVHALLALFPFIAIGLFLGHRFGLVSLQVFPVLLILIIFLQGVTLFLSSLNVFFRDVRHVLDPIMQLMFYLSPVLYPMSMIPEKYQFIMIWNPFRYFLDGFRFSLYSNEILTLPQWGGLLVIALVALLAGCLMYLRTRDRFIYYV
jgi:ABC-2 type transport system permease protein